MSDEPGRDASEEPSGSASAEEVSARELLSAALVDDEDPRFPRWLPLPGLAGAIGWAAYDWAAADGAFLATLVWPGVAILALVTLATWFGWQLDID